MTTMGQYIDTDIVRTVLYENIAKLKENNQIQGLYANSANNKED